MSGRLKAVAVYCGYRIGNDPAYEAAAVDLGRALAARDCALVYGGGGGGMMRTVADATLDAGGRVIGVIPVSLVEREAAHERLSVTPDASGSRLEIVPDMHIRKARMLELSDACAVLPGGIGTMDELFEAFTWAQLGLHAKPCGIINTEGYYDALLQWLDDAVTGGFLGAPERRLLCVEATPTSLLDLFEARADG